MQMTNLMVMSLDGEIATRINETSSERIRQGLSNEEDQQVLKEEIAKSDAIIIGAKTIRADQKILEIKNDKGKFPIWIVLSQNGLAENLDFWKQKHIPRVIISQTPLPSKQLPTDVSYLCYGHAKPGHFVVNYLSQRGVKKALLLGGGELNRVFYEEDLVDELKLTIAPILIGQGLTKLVNSPLSKISRLQLIESQAKESFLFLRYKVLRPPFHQEHIER